MSPLRQKMLDRMVLRGLAVSTHKAYIRWVAKLSRFYDCSPDKLDDKQLQTFMLHLINKKKLSASTCRQAIHSLRFFYAEVVGREVSRFELPSLKTPSKIPELLSRAEVMAIINACDSLKYRTMMLVAYGTGMRLNEVTHLQVTDIDSDRGVLRVECGKGKKDRYVLLNDSLLSVLRDYWRVYRPQGPMFYGLNNCKPITNGSLQRVFRRAVRKAGINKAAVIHSLRHAFATHSLEAGMPLAKLQQLLGHQQISTTLHYIHWLPRYKEQPGDAVDLLSAWEMPSC